MTEVLPMVNAPGMGPNRVSESKIAFLTDSTKPQPIGARRWT